jgi:hypothetical protein
MLSDAANGRRDREPAGRCNGAVGVSLSIPDHDELIVGQLFTIDADRMGSDNGSAIVSQSGSLTPAQVAAAPNWTC